MTDQAKYAAPAPPQPAPGRLRRIVRGVLLAILLIPFAFVAGCEVLVLHNKSASERINRTNGSRILSALQGYYKDHGRYPDTLGTLVPTYTRSLPKYGMSPTRQDMDFDYKPAGNGQQFELSFMGSPVTIGPCDCRLRYSSATGRWQDIPE